MKKEIELIPKNNLPGREETYVAPIIETVEVRVEKGFECSDGECEELEFAPFGSGGY